MEFTFLHFKVVILDICDELGQVRVLWHIVAIGHYAQMCLGTRDCHIKQIGVIRELCWSVIYRTHNDGVTLTSLILMHRTGNISPDGLIDFLCL